MSAARRGSCTGIRLGFPALLVAGALMAEGCGRVAYVARSGFAEARILWRREPIADLLTRPDLDGELRARLELALAVRRHAGEALGLAVGESFASFVDVEGEAIVWVVSAAHRDRLDAYTWWYPIVGRVPYQGYFARGEADAAAGRLAADGFDVDVRPAAAFSTLGWFADPLLSVTAKAAPVVLAETILHELFHATLYVPGNAPFNESAATFVGHRGAIDFFCDGDARDAARCAEARDRWRRVRAHGRVIERLADRLRTLYATPRAAADRERIRARLATVAGRTLERRRLGQTRDVSPPNNARLLSLLAYETALGTFEASAPDATRFGEVVRRLVAGARSASDPFAALRAMAPPPVDAP